jgi:excisionase family DNA binding protein
LTKLLTVKQAAEILKVSRWRVYELISLGRLRAEKLGRDLVIKEEDLKAVAVRKNGRPRKNETKV